MKPIFVCFAIFISVSAQDATSDLMRGQAELTVGHEYIERQLQINRNIISSYIDVVSVGLLDSFMDTYSELHNIDTDTRAVFDELGPVGNFCLDDLRERWSLQYHRFGSRLSSCLGDAVIEVSQWNTDLNGLHSSTGARTNQVQNCAVDAMATMSEFTGTDSLYEATNRCFRILLRDNAGYLDLFESIRSDSVDNEFVIIDALTQCDRNLAAAFANESLNDIARATACFE